MKKPIDVHKTLKLTTEAHDRRMVILAVIGLVVGAFFLFVATKSRGVDNRWLGAAMMVFAIGYLIRALLRSTEPRRPLLELSTRGVVYRGAGPRDVVISWDDVSGIETIYRGRRRGEPIYDVAIVAPRRLIGAQAENPETRQSWLASPNVQQRGDHTRIVLPHSRLSMSYEQLRDELVARWRAFSAHPDAKIPPVSPVEGPPGWTMPQPVKIGLAAASVALLLPAIYYFHWINLWLLTPAPNEATQNHYFQELITRGSVSARKVGGGMIRVGNLQIASVSYTQCKTEIFRVDEAQTWLPRYDAVSYCTTDLRLKSGEGAIAIWRIHTKRHSYRDWNDKEVPMRYRAASTLDAEEGEARLCEMGRC